MNIELDKKNLPLGKGAMDAIINATDTMHKHEDDFIKNPIQYMDMKWKTERTIAHAFGEENSKIGLFAHTAKGALEAAICVAAQPFIKYSEAHEQKTSTMRSGKSTQSIKERLESEKASEAPKEDIDLGEKRGLNI